MALEAGTLVTTGFGNAKLTISIKRRLPNGDEVFLAPGIEIGGDADAIDETIATVTEKVNGWMENLLAAYPDSDPVDDEDEADEEEEGDEEEEAEEEGDEEEEELTEADVKKMTKKQLEQLAEDFEFEFEEKVLGKMRTEAIEILFAEEGEEEEETEEEEEAEEGEEEEVEAYEEDELKALKLEQLQEILTDWEIDHPTFKKGTQLPAKKKAYIKAILEGQEE